MTMRRANLLVFTLLGALAAATGWAASPEKCKGMMIGYNEYRTDLATGDACNQSNLPCVIDADGTGRRVLAPELKKDDHTEVVMHGWSDDGQSAKLIVVSKDPEVTKWEEEHKDFKPGGEKL